MQGFMLTLFTEQDRRHGHQPLHEWLLEAARSVGVRGGTTISGGESFGKDGRRHSAHFFELTDQPIEVQIAVSEQQFGDLLALLQREKVDVFYAKTPVEFGRTSGSE